MPVACLPGWRQGSAPVSPQGRPPRHRCGGYWSAQKLLEYTRSCVSGGGGEEWGGVRSGEVTTERSSQYLLLFKPAGIRLNIFDTANIIRANQSCLKLRNNSASLRSLFIHLDSDLLQTQTLCVRKSTNRKQHLKHKHRYTTMTSLLARAHKNGRLRKSSVTT